ncbi:MAG: dTDP-4-dehydrorhamnose reductase [Thermodesulfobacteriota bacterium]
MSKASKVLVLGGKGGLLGACLAGVLEKAGCEVAATGRPGREVFETGALQELLDRTAPDTVFNTWAYTQVDKAEDEPAEARRINEALPALLGRLVLGRHVKLVHFSTDFVFDGRKDNPYTPEDPAHPASVYGETKLAGERALLSLNLPNLLIVRTAWLFGPGKKNFVRTILDLAREREEIRVVHDQVGSPTYTCDLAAWAAALAGKDAAGIFHVVNSGRASWAELAAEAIRLADLPCRVTPIPSSEYPQKARRPAYSVLDTGAFTRATGITPRPWAQALADYVYREAGPDQSPDNAD